MAKKSTKVYFGCLCVEIDEKYTQISGDINSVFDKMAIEVEKRRKAMLFDAEKIRKEKIDKLRVQFDKVSKMESEMGESVKTYKKSMESGMSDVKRADLLLSALKSSQKSIDSEPTLTCMLINAPCLATHTHIYTQHCGL